MSVFRGSVLRTPYSVLGTQYLVRSTQCILRRQSPRLACFFAPLAILFLATPLLADEPAKKAAESSDLPTLLFVFMLATFIGMGVITRVSRLLHTPLMSLTNAISAIAVVGAIAVAGHQHVTQEGTPTLSYLNVLGAIALFASMTNIVSGFLLTDRMVKMFKSREGVKS